MGKWTEAPDGQPTENIELQLATSKRELSEAILWQADCEKRLASAKWIVANYGASRERLTWQLEQRKKREEG